VRVDDKSALTEASSILSLDRASPDWSRRMMLSRSIELAGVAAAAMVKST
jgi:hypothetical protein